MKRNETIFLLFFLIIPNLWPHSTYAADLQILQGMVSDVFNKPVSGAEIHLYTSSNVKRPADFLSKKSDKKGFFQLTLPVGNYWAVAILRKDDRRFGPLGIEDKHSGEPIAFEMQKEKTLKKDFVIFNLREAALLHNKKSADLIKITGRILDSKGEPMAMAYAAADLKKEISGIPKYISAWTESSGEYILYLPLGQFFLGAAQTFPPNRQNFLNTAISTEKTKQIDLIFKKLK